MAGIIQPIVIYVLVITIQITTAVPFKNSKIPPVNLHYECIQKIGGEESKAPIILLHGIGSDMDSWDGTYETLAFETGRRICRCDIRNHGDSPWNTNASVAAMVEDVIHLMDTIGAERAVIIGHSLGGKIAMNTALTYPARVISLVAEEIVPNPAPEHAKILLEMLKKYLAMMDQVPEGSDEEQAAEILLPLVQEMLKEMNLTISEEKKTPGLMPFTCAGGKCHWKANLKVLTYMMEFHRDEFFSESIGLYDSPALFIYGTESVTNMTAAKPEIRSLFPKVKFVGVEGAGHGIHGFFPQFEDEVVKFLQETNTL